MFSRPTVSKLDKPIYAGDWHDKPLKWTAIGPANQVQNFGTRKSAERYARLRFAALDQAHAIKLYVHTSL